MVLSNAVSGTERHAAHIANFSTANENYVETFINVDNTAENDPSGTISSGHEMTIGIGITPRGRPRLVDFTIRRDNGHNETYSCESMSAEEQQRMLHHVFDFTSIGSQRTRCDECSTRQARKFYHESFGFNGGSEKGNVDQGRRYSDSTDSSSGGRTRPDRKRRGDDSPQSNRRKKARINSLESARIARGPQRRSLETFPVVDGDRLMIGDEKAVMAFYRRLLADGQQELCKKLAKWWIRAIHPNKQTNHPYAKGPEKKPPWWPLTPPNNAVGEPIKGTMENGFVRHKEPDHLSKAERLNLMPHLLNQVVYPDNNTQFNGINATKLYQISMDSINNETTDKDKHETWRRFVQEIFRVAKQQERYKNGEIDDTTAIPVRPSYDSWRYKGYNDEAEEDSKSDGEDDEDESDRGKVSTTESVSEVVSGPEYEDPSQSLGDDTKKGYANYVHNARFSSQRQNGTDSQSSFQRVNDIPNPNHPPYSSQMASMARTYQQPNLMLQEPFRRHSDSSERFSSSGPLLSNFLPNANIAHIANLQFQTIQPSFQLPATSISPSGPVLPSPLSVPIARPLADVPHFPAFHDTSLFPRSNAAFQATVRDPIFGSHGNLQQLPQQQQNFQDYLHSQHYGHDAPKMHILNLNNETRSEFKYDQENASNVPRSKFAYEVKPQCSLEPATFDLDEIENGGSNGHS